MAFHRIATGSQKSQVGSDGYGGSDDDHGGGDHHVDADMVLVVEKVTVMVAVERVMLLAKEVM